MSRQIQSPESPALLTAEQVAQMISVSKRSVWRMLSARQIIKPVRLGGSTRWRRDELLKWIDAGCPPQTAA